MKLIRLFILFCISGSANAQTTIQCEVDSRGGDGPHQIFMLYSPPGVNTFNAYFYSISAEATEPPKPMARTTWTDQKNRQFSIVAVDVNCNLSNVPGIFTCIDRKGIVIGREPLMPGYVQIDIATEEILPDEWMPDKYIKIVFPKEACRRFRR